jgi:hypothetical protein
VSPAAEFLPDTERRRLRALVSADTAAAAPLHVEDYQLITPNGAALSKDGYLGAIASGQPATAAAARPARSSGPRPPRSSVMTALD